MRSMYGRGFQGYQPQFRPYRAPGRYQGAQGYQGYQDYQQGYQGYQPSSGFRGTPQYRPEQEFTLEYGFEGRHENFPGGSNWG